MDAIQQQHHVEDVGRILLQTQEQLRLMREQMTAAANSTVTASMSPHSLRHNNNSAITQADVHAFNEILQKAEAEIRSKAELVLNGMVNTSFQSTTSTPPPINLLPAVATSPAHMRSRTKQNSTMKTRSSEENNEVDIEYFRSHFRNNSIEIQSPNSYQSPAKAGLRHMSNNKGRVIRTKTTHHARLLPSVNKLDPSAPVPVLVEEDAKCGMLSLLHRGFLPVGADLTPAFFINHGSIMKHGRSKIYDRAAQPVKPMPYTNPSGFNIATLKFDLSSPTKSLVMESTPGEANNVPKSPTEEETRTRGPNTIAVTFEGTVANKGKPSFNNMAVNNSVVHSAVAAFTSNQEYNNHPESAVPDLKDNDADENDMEELRKNVDKIRGYNELLDTYSLHQFIIHKGRAMRSTPEFISFKRVAQDIWGSVEEVIRALETLLTRYFVPLAYIDGQRLMTVAAMELSSFTTKELLSCIVNEDQVASLIRRPGQRYKGKDRKRRAATTIQNVFRMWWHRNKYQKFRHKDVNAAKIQRKWRTYAAHVELKRKLEMLREQQHKAWEARMQHLQRDWQTIKMNRRVIIHVPSFSIDERSRLNAENFSIRQNLQLSRLCGIMDANVEIVYVVPFELTADVTQYFMKLLQLGGISDPLSRIKLVFPEQATRFPAHFSLTSLLLYSPHCLRRIKRYIKGKEAYLVMGIPGKEDQRLAMVLDVPIMGLNPLAALPLLTKSGGKRFFMQADVNVPTGTYDIYDEDELRFALAKLIILHMDQQVWLVKLDFDAFGTGVFVIDVSTLQVLRDVRREKRSAEYWKQPGVRDSLARGLMAELERNFMKLVHPVFPEVYGSWQEFAAAMAQYGAVIEAAAASTIGHVRANLFLEPDGKVHVASTHNIVTGEHARRPIGYAFPQTAAPYEAIRGASMAIGKLLMTERVWGYVSVDYCIFRDESTNAPRLWAIALHPFLTDCAATFAIFHLLNRGSLNPHTGKYHLPAPAAASSLAPSTSAFPIPSSSAVALMMQEASHSGVVSLQSAGAERSYVVSDYVFHPNVSTMQYSAFFHICRLHGVCFDVERSVGTVFLLVDSLTAGIFGVMCVGDTPAGALSFLRTALEVIGREVGTQTITESATSDHMGNFTEILATIRALSGGKAGKLDKLRRLRRN